MTICIRSLCVVIIASYVACDSTNNSAVLISRYSKVAHWGQGQLSLLEGRPSTEGRSSSGQALWTHRSDANIVGGQNLQTAKPVIAYHYAMPSRKSQRYEEDASDNQPAVGEVQERFNAKPYFNYAPALPQKQNVPSNTNNNRPLPQSPFYNTPSPDVRPVFAKGPPSDSYSSPFNSYNPPAESADGDKGDDPVYPPIDQVTSSDAQNNIAPPSEETPLGYSYTPPSNGNGLYYDGSKKPSPPKQEKPHSFVPQSDSPQKPSHGDHDFYPSGDMRDHEVILDHPPPGYEEAHKDFGDMSSMDNHGMVKAPDMGEGDLNPPPSDDFNPYVHSPGNPEESHDFGAYDDFDHHHVYPVVEHPTTKAPPHDERVNKGHYSYYYLGRKLWYIPLYFSVYFIIYVTILILKSIARHKINFKHELHDKFSNRQARTMSTTEDINDLHRNVTTGIDIMNKQYMMM